MEPIQINVTLKFDEDAKTFLKSLFNQAPIPASFGRQDLKPADAQAPAPAFTGVATSVSTAAPAQVLDITIDKLREVAMTKMNAHRVEIKQKLDELGTPSITKLDKSKYEEMLNFLNSLS